MNITFTVIINRYYVIVAYLFIVIFPFYYRYAI